MDKKYQENLVEKIEKRKQETEKLKQDLKRLIDSGIHPPAREFEFKPISNNYYNLPHTSRSNLKVFPQEHPAKKPAIIGEALPCSRKNTGRGKETAEFMNKQRETRLQAIRHQEEEKARKESIKKRNLEELHRKTLELVKKNLKRKSRSRVDLNCAIIEGSSTDKPLARSRSASNSRACPAVEPQTAKSRFASAESLTAETSRSGNNPNLLYPAVHVWHGIANKKTEHSCNNVISKTSLNDKHSNINSVSNKVEEKQHKCCSETKDEKIVISSDIMIKPQEKFPVWLKDSSPQADPFNVINTVNRRLKYVSKDAKNHLIDVGVQNSISVEKAKNSKIFSEHSGSDTSKNIPSLNSEINSKSIQHLEAPITNLNSYSNLTQYSATFEEYSNGIELARRNLFIDDDELNNAESLRRRRESVISTSPNLILKPSKPASQSDTLNESNSANTKFRSLSSFRPSTDKETSVSLENDAYLTLTSPKTNLIVSEKTDSNTVEEISFISKIFHSKVSSTSGKNAASKNIISESSKQVTNKGSTSSKISEEIFLGYSDVTKSSTAVSSKVNQKKDVSKPNKDSVRQPKTRSVRKTSIEEVLSKLSHLKSDDNIPETRKKDGLKLTANHLDLDKESVKIRDKELHIERSNIMKNISVRSKANQEKVELLKNISIRSNDLSSKDLNTSQKHSKFEAEIDLLNDFNQSLKQLSEIEKEFNCLRSKNESDETVPKTVQNRDTQTSKSLSQLDSQSLNLDFDISNSQLSFINFRRGTGRNNNDFNLNLQRNEDFSKNISELDGADMPTDSTVNSVISLNPSSTTQILSFKPSECSKIVEMNENIGGVAGLSLMLFDQMVKEGDARLENLKINLEIRKKALLDRTKLELLSLQEQKRKLQKNHKLDQASEVRKRQRGILMRLQQENHEIHKIKQMQYEATQKRKHEINRKTNLIKNQLFTEKSLEKPRLIKPKERRRSTEPLRVIQTKTHSAQELVNEIKSTSKSRSTSEVPSESCDDNSTASENLKLEVASLKSRSSVALAERTLLMRQEALDKRRKAAEELLQWHKKLVEEEKAVAILEETAKNIVFQTPSQTKSPRLTYLKRTLSENDVETISQEVVIQSIKTFSSQVISSQVASLTDRDNYSADFEAESVENNVDQSKITSINDLIDDFNKIQEELSIIQTEKSLEEIENDTNVESDKESEVSSHIDKSKAIISESKTSSQVEEIENQIVNSNSEEEEESKLNAQHTHPSKTAEEQCDNVEETDRSAIQISVDVVVPEASDIISVPKPKSEHSSEPKSEETEVVKDSEIVTKIDSEIVSENTTDKNSIEEQEAVQDESIPAFELNLDLLDTLNASVSSDDDQGSTTSRQIEDLPEESVAPLSKEARTSFVDEKDHDSLSEDRIVQPAVSVEDQSLENKTDEEKVASIRSYSNQNESESPRRFTLSEEYAAQLNASSNNSSAQSNVPSNTVQTEKSSSSSINTERSSAETIKTSRTESDLSQKRTCSTEALSPRLLEIRSPKGNAESSRLVDDRTPKRLDVDVKKKVLEILSETSPISKKDSKSFKDDTCVMTYDLASPFGSPEAGPSKESLGNEAQELLRKQLAIEQEIKLLTAQQQKEATPIAFVREIPNKPPPPYKPSVTKSPKKSVIDTVIPKPREIEEIASYSAKIIHKAYETNNLENTNISDNTLNLIAKDINKECYKFLFDICKEFAIEYYSKFKKEEEANRFGLDASYLSTSKPLDVQALERLLKRKLMESFNYEKPAVRHSSIISWCKEKIRDHVDAVLTQELSAEESTWNNFKKQEKTVKNKVFDQVFQKLFDDALKDLVKALEDKYSYE